MENRLRVLRAERRWSQARLADEVGVSRQTINAIETGRYDPSLSVAFRLADAFDTTIDALFVRGRGPARGGGSGERRSAAEAANPEAQPSRLGRSAKPHPLES